MHQNLAQDINNIVEIEYKNCLDKLSVNLDASKLCSDFIERERKGPKRDVGSLNGKTIEESKWGIC